MTEPKRKPARKTSKAKTRSDSSVRSGGTRLAIPNSGLEVWLYDDANLETIRGPEGSESGFGGMPARFDELTRDGLIVGYSLYQDDEVNVEVHVGEPFTEKELSVARWLEPQRAFLRLPSGRLSVESNDASRIGPEDPTEKGDVVELPPGDYGLTLYRVDHEALDRERMTWTGPQELIVFTPDGNPSDAATDFLAFEPRRDNAWVGRYSIHGRSADALAWFSDYWDTCIVNIDSEGADALGLVPGSYFRTSVPGAGLSLVSVFGKSWDEAKRLPPPAGIELEEYGYAAFCNFADWDGAEGLFLRRDATKTRVEDEQHNIWLPAVVEVLDVEPLAPAAAGETCVETDLRSKVYFDSGFLPFILSDVLPGVDDLDELELSDAVDRFDRKFEKMGLEPQGDVSWTSQTGAVRSEATCRFYTGLPGAFAVILALEGSFEVFFVSELEDGAWVVTGLADDIARRITSKGPDGLPRQHPLVRLELMDESLSKILTAHKAALKKAKATAAPVYLDEAVATWERFVAVAFGPLPANER